MSKQTVVQWLLNNLLINGLLRLTKDEHHLYKELKDQAKAMEKEQHEKFNKFLNVEKKLGIADLKTIERIQWYYNTYFNETYGGDK